MRFEEAKNLKNAQLLADIQTVGPTSVQLKNDGFSIAVHSCVTPSVQKKSLPKESWEKNARTQGNSGCVRANNFKVFLDREKLQTNYPRFLRRLAKNPRIRLDQKLDQLGELSENRSSSVSSEKINSVQNDKDLVHLRMDIRTSKRSYEMQHGGIPDINMFVDHFFQTWKPWISAAIPKGRNCIRSGKDLQDDTATKHV